MKTVWNDNIKRDHKGRPLCGGSVKVICQR